MKLDPRYASVDECFAEIKVLRQELAAARASLAAMQGMHMMPIAKYGEMIAEIGAGRAVVDAARRLTNDADVDYIGEKDVALFDAVTDGIWAYDKVRGKGEGT